LTNVLDIDALYVALDARRRAERKTWRDVARECDLSPSMFSRMGLDLRSPSAEHLCRLLLWLGDTDVKPFLWAEVRVPDAS
jgi:transcriptional regulator with XRE-family HTH domain